MFLILDKNREMIGELTEWLSITASIRFSSPGQLTATLSENSDEANLIQELMYIFNVETSTLFLIDYIDRSSSYNDKKAVIVKGITIEGFLDQRMVFEDKLLEGAPLQTALHDLLYEHAIEPADTTRTLDFFSFVDSVDPHVTSVTVKGLVSGISVMQAITSLLEAKNLGYQVTYSMTTKKASFKIVAGRNLCPGFASILHGTNLLNTVSLSAQSETLKDISSVVDLANYKTRVYVRNFDETKIFNRGTTLSGINLREGYLSTGHGDGLMDIPEIPPPPKIEIPPVEFPGEVPIPEAELETNLVGLYVLTNKNRLLACAFYPDLPVPEVWIDITPDQEEDYNIPITPTGSKVTLTNGDLVFASENRKKLYRASMIGGWLGTRYFEKAIPFYDVESIDIAVNGTYGNRIYNSLGSFGVDVYTGQVTGTVYNSELDGNWAWGNSHHARVFDGTTYDSVMITETFTMPVAVPHVIGRLNINNNRITLSGISGTLSSRLIEFNGTTWEILGDKVPPGFGTSWHARPERNRDVTYTTAVYDAVVAEISRSKDLFGGGPTESFVHPDRFDPLFGAWSQDGKSIFTLGSNRRFCITTFAPGALADSTALLTQYPFKDADNPAGVSSAGTDKATGIQRWGYMIAGRSGDEETGNHSTPAYYVTSNPDFTELTNMTPLLKVYLKFGPWGTDENGLLNEWPTYHWPILG